MAQVEWRFDDGEIDRIREIVASQSENPFVRKRREKNVKPAEINISKDRFWNAHLAALLTSQQRSGPDSHVSQFLKEGLITLRLDHCQNAGDVKQFVSERLNEYGGIRYYNNIGEACEKNLERLNPDGWQEIWEVLDSLIDLRRREPRDNDYEAERDAARFLTGGFAGEGLHRIGPKQSRNLLQILGLTRYEIPLDSRITRWLNADLDLPYRISSGGLSNPEYYHFIMDIVRDGCSAADGLPCLFDAAVFSSYDTGWTQSDAEAIF